MNRSVAFLAALCNTGPAWAQNLSPQIGYHNTGYIVGYHNTGETVGELGSVGPALTQNAVNDPSHVCSTDMQSPCREAPATAIFAYPSPFYGSGSSVTPSGCGFLYQCDSPSVPTDPDLTRALAICQTHRNDSHGITTLPTTHWSDDYREDCEAVWAAYASRELDAVKARESTNKGWLHQYAEKLKQKDVKP